MEANSVQAVSRYRRGLDERVRTLQGRLELTQQFPEYQLASTKIDLTRFKRIFFIEYAHRVLGNVIGVLYSVPLVYFLARGAFKKKMVLRMLGLLGIGAS